MTRDDARLSEALRDRVVRRVLLALSRFGPRVTKVSVRLAEPANPLGGVDQRCRMRAWLHGRDGLHAEAINGGFEAAVTRAALRYASHTSSSGTYPNDLATQREVERARESHANVERIVCPKDGPTNKADCLNWIIQGVRRLRAAARRSRLRDLRDARLRGHRPPALAPASSTT